MLNPRILMFGTMPGYETVDAAHGEMVKYYLAEDSQEPEPEGILDCVIVIPVIARPSVQSDRAGWVDNTAEVVVGDVPDTMSLSAFEQTLAEYNGTDRRGTPVVNFDDVSADMFS